MIRALLGATLYYLLPLFVGYGVLAGRGGSFPTAWASGSFALLALVGFANLGFGGSAPELRHGFLALSVAILAAMGVREILRRFQDRKRWPMELTLAVTAIVGVALLAQCVLRSDSPYPSFVNWDGLQHLTLAREMNRGEFSLDLTRYSDTFQLATYVPVYHAPLFLAWAASGATPEGLYWFLDLLHGFMAALVTCRLGWSIRKRPLDALLAGSLGALTLESQIAMTGFSHMPQNLAGMYFALCVADFLDRKVPPRELGIQLLYLGAAHFFVGGFGVALLVALHVLQTFERRDGLMLGLKAGGVLIVALSVLLAGYNSEFRLDPFSIGDSAAFNLDADQKNDLFRHWYGYGYYVYGVLLAVLAWRTHEVRLRVLCVVSGLLVPAILFPFPYTFKLFALAHFVLATLVAAALGGAFLQGRKRLVQAVNLALLLGAWFIIFALNQELSLKRWLRFEGVFTLVSEDETAAARFLDQPRYRQTLLVAEPATQHILEGLGGVNTAGGTYATAATRGQLMDILGSDSPEHVRGSVFAVRDALRQGSDDIRLLAVGARAAHWMALDADDRLASFENIWTPRRASLRDEARVTLLARSPGFRLVFENSGIALLEVTRPSGP